MDGEAGSGNRWQREKQLNEEKNVMDKFHAYLSVYCSFQEE